MNKFADEATITVSSGKGGNGCISFRREKHVPRGGPAGGDGGRGGDVVFEVRRNLRTLAHLRFVHVYRAQGGADGSSGNKYGLSGEDVIIPVPPGTIIRDAKTGETLREFVEGQGRWVFLRGGNGGWGNTHFKSSVNQAPRIALDGKPAEERQLQIELQLLADIGFVGFPNAGKSSLLDYFTNARPKIAPYPFTTKIPNLGVLTVHERDVILADIPGIIEGASEGVGLGFRFLRHISRAAALAFLIDLSDENWREAFGILLAELSAFSPELAVKKRIVIGTKLDLEESSGRLDELKAHLKDERVVGISVFSGEGMDALREAFLGFVLEAEAALDTPPTGWAASTSPFAQAAPAAETQSSSDDFDDEDTLGASRS